METEKDALPNNHSTNRSLPFRKIGGAYYLKIPDKKYPRWAQEILDSNARIYKKPVELRSEKVRNIIGQVPPVLLRYGIAFIGLALLVLVGISAFIPYQPYIDVKIKVAQTDDGSLEYSTQIPQNAMKNRTKFMEITLRSSAELPLPARFEIESISDVVQVSEHGAWQSATLRPKEDISTKIILDKPIVVSGKILLKKKNVMMWVVGKVAD